MDWFEEPSEFSAAMVRQEYRVVETLAAEPALVRVFKEAGGSIMLFDEMDARAIFVAIAHCYECHEDKARAKYLAEKLLCKNAFFDNSAVKRTGPGIPWCDESLAVLFNSYPISETAVRTETTALIFMKRRAVTARDHLRIAAEQVELSSRERHR